MQQSTGNLPDTLVERVKELIHPRNAPHEWGHPSLSVTPNSLAIHDLAQRVEALEKAIGEIALEVQKLSD